MADTNNTATATPVAAATVARRTAPAPRKLPLGARLLGHVSKWEKLTTTIGIPTEMGEYKVSIKAMATNLTPEAIEALGSLHGGTVKVPDGEVGNTGYTAKRQAKTEEGDKMGALLRDAFGMEE